MQPDVEALARRLPDWSATSDPARFVDTSGLVGAAIDVCAMPEDERRELIAAYSAAHCYPELVAFEASGLYVMMRVLFELPAVVPRDQARDFGGWLHPSRAGDGGYPLGWPVRVEGYTVHLAAFAGYAGGGWDALGEYDYFIGKFPLRDPVLLLHLAVDDTIER